MAPSGARSEDIIQKMKILDISCGTGYGSKLLADNKAQEVWAGDNSEDVIKLAKEKYNKENLHFRVMDAEELPFEDNYFDILISLETIEHIKDYKQFIREIKRVLKPGGKLILSTPNRKAVQQLGIKNFYHIKEFTRQELLELLDQNFKDIKLFGQRKIRKLTLKQKLIKKIYFLYTKIFFLRFLKSKVPDKFRKKIGNEIEGLSDNFEIIEMEDGEEYLYFVVVATVSNTKFKNYYFEF